MEMVHPIKTRHQLARAHKLVAVIDGLPVGCCNETRLTFAQRLAVQNWADIALLTGITAPSITTVTMAISLLEQRVVTDEITADADAFACFTGAGR